MSADLLRRAANAMRGQHGPDHPRYEMWQAMAAWLDSVHDAQVPDPGRLIANVDERHALAVASAYLGES